jgi:UDP-N-acetylglucosamine acyltransferase
MSRIHPSAIIAKGVKLADDVKVGPNCVIDKTVSIGEGSVLDSNVVVGKNVTIGRNNHFFPNCVIGGIPQVLGLGPDDRIGKLIVGDNNIIREYVTIHSSIYVDEVTRVGNDNLLMVGVHIGHDCVLEDKIVMSNLVQLSGHCRVGTGTWLSGVVLLHQFVTIGKWCYAAGLAGINHDVPSFLIVSGHYPPKIRGVNKRGMERAGLTEQQQQKILDAYKKLYRRGSSSLLENAKLLAQEDGLDENVRSMVDMIIKSSGHRFGRYLELFRKPRTGRSPAKDTIVDMDISIIDSDPIGAGDDR